MQRDDELDKELGFTSTNALLTTSVWLTSEEAATRATPRVRRYHSVKEAIRDQDSWRVLDGFPA